MADLSCAPRDAFLAAESAVKVKICGLTREADVVRVLRFFPDALGFIFATVSLRAVDVERAAALSAQARELSSPWSRGPVLRVGVFVDASPEEVLATAERVDLDAVQLHGSESPEHVAAVVAGGKARNLRVIKALAICEHGDIPQAGDYADAWAVLLDTYSPHAAGGTGECFDWSLAVPAAAQRRVILAGGLRPWNVQDAIAQVRPFMVDVAGGVEEAPGAKDINAVLSFIHAARQAAAELPA